MDSKAALRRVAEGKAGRKDAEPLRALAGRVPDAFVQGRRLARELVAVLEMPEAARR